MTALHQCEGQHFYHIFSISHADSYTVARTLDTDDYDDRNAYITADNDIYHPDLQC